MVSGLAKVWAAAMLALLVTPPSPTVPFSAALPAGVPSGAGWERFSGNIEVDDPPLRAQYEFYVNPARPMLYEVVRYRITQRKPEEGDRYEATERLQWHQGANHMKRWECVAEPAQPSRCRWNELVRDTREYSQEVEVILWLYGQHNRMENARLAGD